MFKYLGHHLVFIGLGVTLASLLLPHMAFAADLPPALAEQLGAKRVLDVQASPGAPLAIRFVRRGDVAPSCGLLLKGGRYVELVSPEPGQPVPACAALVGAPIRLSARLTYVVYGYQVEDPRAQITQTYQLFRVMGDDIHACVNDDQLSAAARKKFRSHGVEASFKQALIQFGCAQ